MAYLLLVFGIIGLDQCAKWMVQLNMKLFGSVEIWHFIKLTYIQNTGAAFGILDGNRVIFIIFTLLIIGIVLFIWRKPWMKRYRLPAAIIVGGAVGNCIDRVFRGYVVDFIDFTYWPIFNIADIAVCTGTILLALLILLDKGGDTEKNTEKGKGKEK